MNTQQIKNFEDFGIKVESKAFIGKSIEMADIIDEVIVIHDYKIEPSKHPKKPGDMCLYLQIEYEGQKRVVFSGSFYLQQMISKISYPESFPFRTIIKKEKNSKRLEFTGVKE